MSESTHTSTYPARLSIDWPEGERRRGSVLLRLLLAIPIVMILGLLGGGEFNYENGLGWLASQQDGTSSWKLGAGAGTLFLPTLLTLLFVRRYPRWWFDWHLAMARLQMRVFAYLLLLRDEYPALEDEQAIHVELDYPDAARLSRGLPLIKWLLVLPHLFCLAILMVLVLLSTVVAWFAILFTGQHPRGLFEYVVGVMRWGLRVQAYALLLTTDEYPPFSLN